VRVEAVGHCGATEQHHRRARAREPPLELDQLEDVVVQRSVEAVLQSLSHPLGGRQPGSQAVLELVAHDRGQAVPLGGRHHFLPGHVLGVREPGGRTRLGCLQRGAERGQRGEDAVQLVHSALHPCDSTPASARGTPTG
jgi:hypothetical protein